MRNPEGRLLKGRYLIERLIGQGGMAQVYKALDMHRHHHVALKVMRQDLAVAGEFERRFRAEAQAAFDSFAGCHRSYWLVV